MAFEIYNEDIYFGRPSPNSNFQDFYFDVNDFALKVRKILIQDIGDPGDMGFGRAGPDNAAYNHFPPEEPLPGSNLGTWYWRAYQGVNNGGFGPKSAQVYARYAGERGGTLHFATTPVGAFEPQDVLVLDHDGTLVFPKVASNRIPVKDAFGRRGYLTINWD